MMAASSLSFSLPPSRLFKFPPDKYPHAVAPPRGESSLASPLDISPHLYQALLKPTVPITIATIYAASAAGLNAYNRSNGNTPWPISKTRAFFIFTICHNVLLAIYSATTFIAMLRGLRHTLPGLETPGGLIGTVDAMCKMHGPRGLGNAASFNPVSNAWEVTNKLVFLTSSGEPDSTDVGRLWNEGLAFWGWVFYLSKFYEILDTFIIIAKGKRSSTLQTYHHAGAMICMWAGIRYMSPPIWLFVFLNSGVHALMYTYYTLSALRVNVPQVVKRTLTTMQISQFIIGSSYAAMHLLISYQVPVSVRDAAIDAITSAPSLASSALSSAAEVFTASSVPSGMGGYLKKLLLRAADEEGVAENLYGGDPIQQQMASMRSKSSNHKRAALYDTKYQYIPCIDTSGESFAIWLNIIYLAPLTVLFVRFFIRSYIRRISAATRASDYSKAVKTSAKKAVHQINSHDNSLSEKLESELENLVRQISKLSNSEEIKKLLAKISQVIGDIGNGGRISIASAREAAKILEEKSKQAQGHLSKELQDVAQKLKRDPTTENDPSSEEQPSVEGSDEAPRGLSATDPRHDSRNYADVVKE